MQKGGFVYMMASAGKTSLYVGMTSNLPRRIWEHKNKVNPSCYTARYNCVVLVYYVHLDLITAVIAEEKRIKGESRKQKEKLINSMNPEWNDLWKDIEDWY